MFSTTLHAVQFRAQDAPELMALAWRLRQRVFNDCLGWAIPDRDLLEIDEFDHRARHAVVLSGGRVLGYVRALPTTEPYLLSRHFPQLLDGPAPQSPDICEISRFAIDPDARVDGLQRRLVREGVALARALGAARMIAVTEPPFERFLRSCGLTTGRLADPQVVGQGRLGAVRALVISCDMTPGNLEAVGLPDHDLVGRAA